jgi:hypothetical protein
MNTPWITSCQNPDCRKMGCSTTEPRPTGQGTGK